MAFVNRLRPITAIRLVLIGVFLILLLYAGQADWRPRSIEDLQTRADGLGDWAPLVAVLAQALGVVFLIPGFLLVIATALIFGHDSIWISMVGQAIGATICYMIARFLGHDFFRAFLGPRMITIERILHEHAFRYLLYLHFLWLIPLPLVTYGPGLVQVKFRDFIAATVLGEIPFIIAMAVFGRSLSRVRSAADLWEPDFLVPAVVLVGLIAIPLFVTLLVRRQQLRARAAQARTMTGAEAEKPA